MGYRFDAKKTTEPFNEYLEDEKGRTGLGWQGRADMRVNNVQPRVSMHSLWLVDNCDEGQLRWIQKGV